VHRPALSGAALGRTAQPGDQLARLLRGDERPPDLDQDPVPRRVAAGVVDPLEVVEVDQHHGQLAAVVPRRTAQLGLEAAAVQQPGERIAVGELLELRLDRAPPPLGRPDRERGQEADRSEREVLQLDPERDARLERDDPLVLDEQQHQRREHRYRNRRRERVAEQRRRRSHSILGTLRRLARFVHARRVTSGRARVG
jgi:hypothetical protein